MNRQTKIEVGGKCNIGQQNNFIICCQISVLAMGWALVTLACFFLSVAERLHGVCQISAGMVLSLGCAAAGTFLGLAVLDCAQFFKCEMRRRSK